MPYGELGKWLAFPKRPEEEQEDESGPENYAARGLLRGGKAIQTPIPVKTPGMAQPGGMAQGNGVPTPQGNQGPAPAMAAGPANPLGRPAGLDDNIAELTKRMGAIVESQPAPITAAFPSRPELPDRPQPRAVDLIPQALAGIGNVFSARSYHPQDYLGQVQAQQKGRRDEQYNDALAKVMNEYQSRREEYSDTLMRHAMELNDHSRRLHETQGLLQTLIEQKFLQGAKTPADTAYMQKREMYRQELDKQPTVKQAEERARVLKAEAVEGDSPIIDEVFAGRKRALEGAPQGIIEGMLGVEPGHGIFEPPSEPTEEEKGRRKVYNKTSEEVLKDQEERMKNPQSGLEAYRKAKNNPNATVEDYQADLKRAMEYRRKQIEEKNKPKETKPEEGTKVPFFNPWDNTFKGK